MTSNPLERFHVAQDRPDAGFASAVAELRTTGKRGHWVWYVFPQLAGLGTSALSRQYAIQGLEEATRYLRDPVLRSRLLEATRAVAERLESGVPLESVMGSEIDSLKLMSSLTLFEHVARRPETNALPGDLSALAQVAGQVLAVGESQGYARCEFTLRELGA